MKDENDILEEYLDKIKLYYDKIYVLDGSDSNEGKEICSKYQEVVFYAKDSDFIKTVTQDWIRKYLYDKIKSECKDKIWVGVLHPDEFPSGNVLELLSKVSEEHPLCETLLIDNIQYFPHVSQQKTWKFEKGDKIEPLLKWGMLPGHKEIRYFKINEDIRYKEIHGWVVPDRKNYFMIDIFWEHFHHKHFSVRSLEQFKKRCKTRLESKWSIWYESIDTFESIFFESLPVARINDGSRAQPEPVLIIK
jgi:hypothetical protein